MKNGALGLIILPLGLGGCGAAYLAATGAQFGAIGHSAYNIPKTNEGAGVGGGPRARSGMTLQQLVTECVQTAWVNWLLEEHTTINALHQELWRALRTGDSTPEADMAMKEACMGDMRTARGTAVIWECPTGDRECPAKEKLKRQTKGSHRGSRGRGESHID